MIGVDLTFLNKYGLIGLLIITFISYSIIPFPSEAAITASSIIFNPFYVMIFALVGSTIGSLTNYYIGHKGIKKLFRKKSGINQKTINLFKKHGAWSIIIFGCLPLIGEPLTILAGSFEMNFWKFLLYSTIGKIIYFTILILFGVGIESLIKI